LAGRQIEQRSHLQDRNTDATDWADENKNQNASQRLEPPTLSVGALGSLNLLNISPLCGKNRWPEYRNHGDTESTEEYRKGAEDKVIND